MKILHAFILVLLLPFSLFTQPIGFNIDSNKLFEASISTQTSIPQNYSKHYVNNTKEALIALSNIQNNGGFGAIIFANGIYNFKHSIQITTPNVIFLSKSADPRATIIQGNGMKPTRGVDNLIRVTADNFIIDGITLEQAGNHLIQIAGEYGANKPIIRNSILQNGYEQLIKVTYDRKIDGKFSDHGLIENCLFQYTAGIGPNFYIGGIDAHGIKNWTIKNNVFVNIASPNGHIAEHAIHFWRDTVNNLVENNIIINSDRGIGFGMRNGKPNQTAYSNLGGIIQNNIIYHSDNKQPFADVGIILEDSPETIVRDNIIYFEHKYPNAIEFRFKKTADVLIVNNKTNRGIMRRNGAQAIIIGNIISKDIPSEMIDVLMVKER